MADICPISPMILEFLDGNYFLSLAVPGRSLKVPVLSQLTSAESLTFLSSFLPGSLQGLTPGPAG